MIPWPCAASSASAICRAIGIASSNGIGPGARPRGQVLSFDELHDQHRTAVGGLDYSVFLDPMPGA
jgi:hypothetical protein